MSRYRVFDIEYAYNDKNKWVCPHCHSNEFFAKSTYIQSVSVDGDGFWASNDIEDIESSCLYCEGCKKVIDDLLDITTILPKELVVEADGQDDDDLYDNIGCMVDAITGVECLEYKYEYLGGIKW